MKLDLLKQLSDTDIQDPLLEIFTSLQEKSNYGRSFEKLSKSEKIIYLIGELESEVNSGGFSNYHFNSSGKYAYEALEALRSIHSKYVYKLLKKSIKIYGKGPTNDGRFGDKEKEELTERQEDKLDKLDSKFYEYKEDIDQLQIDFVKREIKQFDL